MALLPGAMPDWVGLVLPVKMWTDEDGEVVIVTSLTKIGVTRSASTQRDQISVTSSGMTRYTF